MSRINLNKNVFNKADFLKTVDTSFTQLVPPTPVEIPVMNVDEFFAEYDRLFYEIPKEGATLRQELLDLNNDKLDLQLELATANTQNLSTSDSAKSLRDVSSKTQSSNQLSTSTPNL